MVNVNVDLDKQLIKALVNVYVKGNNYIDNFNFTVPVPFRLYELEDMKKLEAAAIKEVKRIAKLIVASDI